MAKHALTRQIGIRDNTLNFRDKITSLNAFNTYFGTMAAPILLIQNGEFVSPKAVMIGTALIRKSLFNNYII